MDFSFAKNIIARLSESSDDKLHPQGVKDWSGPFPLPDEVTDYYQNFGPSDLWLRGYGNPYHLPSLADLWQYQAGYRSIIEECPDAWCENWLVIADEGADPFIFDMQSKQVLFNYHDEMLDSEPFVVFGSLVEMVGIMATVTRFVEKAHAVNQELMTPEGYVRHDYFVEMVDSLADVFPSREAAINALSSLISCPES